MTATSDLGSFKPARFNAALSSSGPRSMSPAPPPEVRQFRHSDPAPTASPAPSSQAAATPTSRTPGRRRRAPPAAAAPTPGPQPAPRQPVPRTSRVDDRRVLSGIVHALRNGGRWADCPREVYGPKKTLYNRFVRWAERGIWERIFSALAGGEDAPDRLFIDSTCIKVHRCAGGGKGGPWPMASAAPRGAATPSSTLSAMRKAGPSSCS